MAKDENGDNTGIVFSHWDTEERLSTAAGEAASWRLGYDDGSPHPGFMHVRWGPGEGAPEHRHKSWTANIVIKGSITDMFSQGLTDLKTTVEGGGQ